MEYYSAILMDYILRRPSGWFFLLDSFRLWVGTLSCLNLFYECRVHFHSTEHGFVPLCHYINLQLLEILTYVLGQSQQTTKCRVWPASQRISYHIRLLWVVLEVCVIVLKELQLSSLSQIKILLEK